MPKLQDIFELVIAEIGQNQFWRWLRELKPRIFELRTGRPYNKEANIQKNQGIYLNQRHIFQLVEA